MSPKILIAGAAGYIQSNTKSAQWCSVLSSFLANPHGIIKAKDIIGLTSGTQALCHATGYPDIEVRDDDPLLFEKETTVPVFFPRQANVLAIEEAKKLGVTTFVLAIPLAYGKVTRYWNEMSFQLPVMINVLGHFKKAYKFEEKGSSPAVHMSDLTVFYQVLVE
ncbi:hypothetical protein F5Y18DRAFT_428830 [Xylariaceae sp. FL1019]|nr:hypothetical protein F5Y18DRAFT_428830 [Xylariaceae sp. FL1019]